MSALAWLRYSLSRQVRDRLSAIKQAGYPVTLRELDNWLGWVPVEKNAALQFMEASYSLIPPESVSTNVSSILKFESSAPLPPELREALQAVVAENFSALQMIHRGAALTKSRYVMSWSNGYQTLVPHLPKTKGLAQLLRLQTIFHSEDGKPDLAVQSLQDLLGLSHSLASEPLILSQLVRNACLAIGCSGLEWLLTQHSLADELLKALLDGLHTAESETSLSSAFAGERCIGIDTFELPARGLLQIFQSTATPVQSNLFGFAFGLRNMTGLRDRDFLLYLEIMQESLNASKAPFPEKLSLSNQIGSRVQQELRDHKFLVLSRMLLPTSRDLLVKEAEVCARLRAAQTALAIEQYRTKIGRLPETLEELKEATVPTDPFDGKPIRYKKLDRGYLVYSVGKDGRDEGGQEKREPNKSGRLKRNQSDDIIFRVER
jgi:hypothetical protein